MKWDLFTRNKCFTATLISKIVQINSFTYFKQFFKVILKKWQDLDTARNVFPFFIKITTLHGTLHIPRAPLKVARAK